MAKSKKKTGKIAGRIGPQKVQGNLTGPTTEQKPLSFYGRIFLLFDVGVTANTGGQSYGVLSLFSFRHARGTRRALFGVEAHVTPIAQSIGWHIFFFRIGFNKRAGETKWTRFKGF